MEEKLQIQGGKSRKFKRTITKTKVYCYIRLNSYKYLACTFSKYKGIGSIF